MAQNLSRVKTKNAKRSKNEGFAYKFSLLKNVSNIRRGVPSNVRKLC